MDKITQINVVLKAYCALSKTVRRVPAKDMMPIHRAKQNAFERAVNPILFWTWY